MSETDLMRRIQIQASRLGARLFRNNVGSAWMGQSARQDDGTVIIKHARRVTFGIPGEGGSDLIGWTPVLITPEMVGRTVAVFSAVEVKTDAGRATPEQIQFLSVVKGSGGIAALVRTVDETAAALTPLP